MKKKRESKRQKKTKNGRVPSREKKALKIYSPGGKLLFTAKNGFSVDYQELLRREKRKSKISYSRGSYKRFSDFA